MYIKIFNYILCFFSDVDSAQLDLEDCDLDLNPGECDELSRILERE